MLADWVLAIEGTEAGGRAALVLALVSAFCHACFGALQKGRYDPWITRGAIDASYLLVALPAALFVFPLPDARLALVLAGVFLIHSAYKWLLAMAYSRGAYTAVYPVVRGTAPIGTICFAWAVFGEGFGPLQWAGVACLSGGIFALAAVNLARTTVGRETLPAALALAAGTGVLTSVYTVYDAWGIRLAPDPFTFLAWFFVVDGLLFPVLAWRRWSLMVRHPPVGPLVLRGVAGAFLGILSFGGVMLATRLDKVGEAAALRETSVVFAALIGWLFLGETVGRLRAGLMIVIALGAILVETGG